jgi:hypothetical protein
LVLRSFSAEKNVRKIRSRSNSHSYDWGTGGKLRHKRPRPEFRGEFGLNPITGRDEVSGFGSIDYLKKFLYISSSSIEEYCSLKTFQSKLVCSFENVSTEMWKLILKHLSLSFAFLQVVAFQFSRPIFVNLVFCYSAVSSATIAPPSRRFDLFILWTATGPSG